MHIELQISGGGKGVARIPMISEDFALSNCSYIRTCPVKWRFWGCQIALKTKLQQGLSASRNISMFSFVCEAQLSDMLVRGPDQFCQHGIKLSQCWHPCVRYLPSWKWCWKNWVPASGLCQKGNGSLAWSFCFDAAQDIQGRVAVPHLR